MSTAIIDKPALTSFLQQHLASRGVMSHPFAGVLGKCVLTQEQLKHYCRTRYSAAPLFEHLAARAYTMAEEQNLPALARALYENLCDERGLDYETRQPHGDGSHSDWRRDFLDAIGLPVGERGNYPLYVYTDTDDVWTLTGMVLAAEYAIPLEYARLLKTMRHSFPETFTPADPSQPHTPAQAKATRYLQDHIEHDAGRHLPDLIQAILQDLRSAEDYTKLTDGILRFAQERVGLYDFIGKEFGYGAVAA